MLRRLSLLAALLWAVVAWTPGYAQEPQPSLDDVARQARKDKEKNATPAKTVITDDSLPSGKGGGAFGLSDLGEAKGAGGTDPTAEAFAGIERAEAVLNKLGPMDRTTLVRTILKDNDVDFPNRRNWESQVFSAKQAYVSHSRELVQEMKVILTRAQALHDSQAGNGRVNPDDPRVQGMLRKVQEIVQDSVRTESAFQAVVMEGQDLAKQAAPR